MKKREAHRHPIRNVRALRKALLAWFAENKKNHPWRRTTDPWAVLVSEIMLQQTTVASVIANRRFEKFLEQFPDIETMTAASEPKILKAWEGLGYYNRVRNLQKAARAVLEDFDGQFPPTAAELEALPGVGRYTAGAVSSFAFGLAAPIVDGNIARVISRLLDETLPVDSTEGQKIIWKTAAELLDTGAPREFNSAIMELGQTVCSPRNPTCLICPLRDFCQCREPESLPVKKPKKQFVKVDEHAFLHLRGDAVLLAMGEGTRRRGFWHLPVREAETCAHLETSGTYRYVITHHKVTVHLYRADPGKLQDGEEFVPLTKLEELPIATPMRKILNAELD